jgi:cytoskeletal protein RodZ
MVQTAGQKLRRARMARLLSVDDAARATKIRPQQITDLEDDEYSNFANLAYARGFLVAYAKFLHVDVRAYLEAFEDTSTFGLDDYQYLSESPVGVYRAPSRPVRRRRRRGRLVAAGSTLGLLAIVVTVWFLVVSFRRLGDLDTLAARQEAREHAGQRGQGSDAAIDKAPMTLPASNPLPVSAPVSQSPAPVTEPPSDKALVTTGTLAAADSSNAIPIGTLKAPHEVAAPALPLPGDGVTAHALTQGPDLRSTLAGAAPANTQAKVRAAKPVSILLPGDTYQGNVPQPVANNSVR